MSTLLILAAALALVAGAVVLVAVLWRRTGTGWQSFFCAIAAWLWRVLSANTWLSVLFRGRRVIVLFAPECPRDRCLDLLARAGARRARYLPLVHGVACHLPRRAVSTLGGGLRIAAVEGELLDAPVLHVEDDVPISASWWPWLRRRAAQPPQTVPWGVERVGAPVAWARTRGDGVRVAILDTGVDLGHPDLAGRLQPGYNALNPSKPPQDDHGHGTHVSGTVAAVDNAIGVVGVAPSALLYPVKVLNRLGSGLLSNLVDGMHWCALNGVQIVNMSCCKRDFYRCCSPPAPGLPPGSRSAAPWLSPFRTRIRFMMPSARTRTARRRRSGSRTYVTVTSML